MSESLRRLYKNINISGKPIEKEIEENTEKYCKGDFTVRLPDGLKAKSIKVKQIKHSFMFGANTFMLDSFDSAEKNESYKEHFLKLFNTAVVGTFWKDYEPKKGEFRFDKNSHFVYRRPPVDSVLDFCKENGLTPKAHNLIWHRKSMQPDWLDSDHTKIMPDIIDYMTALSGRYNDVFKYIDVANEHLCRGRIGQWGNDEMPDNYVYEAFKAADKLFKNSKLLTNENHMNVWVDYCLDSSPYYIYLQSLISHGCRVDSIGMQYHAFISKVHEEWFGTGMMDIECIDKVLKGYGSFNKPIQISEITIPSTLFGEKTDEGLQREITENLFRLWFSNPNAEAIIWWNLSDGAAFENEDEFKGALLRSDMSEKPVYEMLDRLINKEWHTEEAVNASEDGSFNFRGFYGEYEISAETDKGTYNFKKTFKRE